MGSSTVLRKATLDDVGTLAYYIMKWDAELPVWLRRLHGDAVHAETLARVAVTSPNMLTYMLECQGEIVGGLCIVVSPGFFSPKPFGQLLMWYVRPESRGGLHGFRLLTRAVELARAHKLELLQVHPWADDVGAQRVLERLGFIQASHVYTVRL